MIPVPRFSADASSGPSRSIQARRMFTIDDLADRLGGYLPQDEIQQVKRAFYYAEQAHDGQRRRSGEPM